MADTDAQYAIWDVVDKVWLGDESGPKVFSAPYIRSIRSFLGEFTEDDIRSIAQLAAQIAEARVYGEQSVGRFRAERFNDEPFFKRDEVPCKRSFAEGYKIETGEDL